MRSRGESVKNLKTSLLPKYQVGGAKHAKMLRGRLKGKFDCFSDIPNGGLPFFFKIRQNRKSSSVRYRFVKSFQLLEISSHATLLSHSSIYSTIRANGGIDTGYRLFLALEFPLVDFRVVTGKENFWYAEFFAFVFKHFWASIDIGACDAGLLAGIEITEYARNLP